MKVLIVDDDEIIRRNLGAMLGVGEHDVFHAGTAMEARKICADIVPEMMLLDIGLPDMDGLDFLDEIADEYPELIVVVVTAFSDADNAIDAMRKGAYDYLRKPINIDEFMLVLARAAERRELLDILNEKERREHETPGLIDTDRPATPPTEKPDRCHTGTKIERNVSALTDPAFAAFVSREIGAPLQAIRTFAELGAKKTGGADPGQLREYFAKILRAQETFGKIIDNFMDFVAISTGQLKLECRPMSLKSLLGEIVDAIRYDAADAGINLRLSTPETPAAIVADRTKIKTALVNVLVNAVTYTPEGGGIAIDLKENCKSVYVSLRDSGIGMPREILDTAFEPFKRVAPDDDNRRKRGYGLAVTKGIVEAHGGTVGIESRAGGGTCVTLKLPVQNDYA